MVRQRERMKRSKTGQDRQQAGRQARRHTVMSWMSCLRLRSSDRKRAASLRLSCVRSNANRAIEYVAPISISDSTDCHPSVCFISPMHVPEITNRTANEESAGRTELYMLERGGGTNLCLIVFLGERRRPHLQQSILQSVSQRPAYIRAETIKQEKGRKARDRLSLNLSRFSKSRPSRTSTFGAFRWQPGSMTTTKQNRTRVSYMTMQAERLTSREVT